jgi:hypothetical protein
MGISGLLKRFFKKNDGKYSERTSHVGFDQERFWVRHSEKEEESFLWKELIGVAIRIFKNEPRTPHVFWILGVEKRLLTYPDKAIGEIKMLKRLQKLPGFNNNAIISAMSCIEDKTFICWESKDFTLRVNGLTNQKFDELVNCNISL